MLKPWILRALGEQICEKRVERKQGGGCLFLIKRPCPPFLNSNPSRLVFSILHNVHNNRINVLKSNKLGAEFWHGESDRNRISCFELSRIIDLQTSGRLRLCWPELNQSYFHSEETIRKRYVWPGAQDRNYQSVVHSLSFSFPKLTMLVHGIFPVTFPITYIVWWELGFREVRCLPLLVLDQTMSQTVPTKGQGVGGWLLWWLRQ